MSTQPSQPTPPDPASAMPFPVAFAMISNFWVSQTIGSLARLGVFNALAERPATAGQLASALELDESALFRAMRACTSFGLITRADEEMFALTESGRWYLTATPGTVGDFAVAMTSPGHWLGWGNFDAALRTGQPGADQWHGKSIFDYYRDHPDEGAHFFRAMGDLAQQVTASVADGYDFSQHQTIVDVGGAYGQLVAAILDAHPNTNGILFDEPSVIENAVAAGLPDRCTAESGDFFRAVPAGDAYLLKTILHDWTDEQSVSILRQIAKSMRPGAIVAVIEAVIPTDGPAEFAHLMDLNMLAVAPGRERTETEYDALFTAAGLRTREHVRLDSPFSLLIAEAASTEAESTEE